MACSARGRMKRSRPKIAVLLLLVLSALAPRAHAHRVGLSRGEYLVTGREVTSRLTFAEDELSRSSPLATIVDQTRISMAGKRCEGVLESTEPAPPDGLLLVLHHVCPEQGAVRVAFDFVGALEQGHRHVAEVTREGRTKGLVAYRGNAELTLPDEPQAAGGQSPAAGFVRLGIEHILTGWDHLLFLLGIVLLPFCRGARAGTASGKDSAATSRRRAWGPLLLAVSAFTVSHSVTLTLGVLGIVPLGRAWVEPLIALSIAYVGVECLIARGARAPHRAVLPAGAPRLSSGGPPSLRAATRFARFGAVLPSGAPRLSFAFGLVHGLGFAGALREIAIPVGAVPVALGCFNIGVELGQLVVLVPLVLLMTWLAGQPLALPKVLRAASVGLLLAGSVLFVDRVWSAARAAAAKGPALATAQGRASLGSVRGPASPRSSGVAASPLADRLCRALDELPRVRRAECGGKKPGVLFTRSCTQRLDQAVRSGAISLVPDEVEACIGAFRARYETCAFAGERSLPVVAACQRVLHGTRGLAETCRSSLECHDGLFCDGAGPLDSGQCRPPRENGSACGLAIDPLEAYVQSAAGADHRECHDACVNAHCRISNARIAEG